MPKGIRYSEEFKRDTVSQVIDRGYSVQEVADRLGITSYVTLRHKHAAKFYLTINTF